jgi:hypothetical protein
MKRHSESDFLAWADQHELGLDSRYPNSPVLTLAPNPQFDRFWTVPPEPERRPYFLATFLYAFGAWSSYGCWRHLGSWPARPDEQRINDQIEHAIFHGVGLPDGSSDIIEFSESERVQLVTLLFATTVFGWSAGDDLFLVPDTALGILQTDHHGVIHASFRDERSMSAFIRRLEAEEFPLPVDVPDATFKIPKWMRNP